MEMKRTVVQFDTKPHLRLTKKFYEICGYILKFLSCFINYAFKTFVTVTFCTVTCSLLQYRVTMV